MIAVVAQQGIGPVAWWTLAAVVLVCAAVVAARCAGRFRGELTRRGEFDDTIDHLDVATAAAREAAAVVAQLRDEATALHERMS